jgi:hypothetical protein
MERRTSENEVRVFRFGSRKGQTGNEQVALDQIWLMNKYRNALVAIDREFRSRYSAVISVDNPVFDRIGAINQKVKELRELIKAQRTGVQRKGWKALSVAEKAEVKSLQKERKGLKPIADEAKTKNKAVYGPAITALNDEFFAAVKAVRAKFSDGTYTDPYGNAISPHRLFWMNEEHIHNNFLKDRAAAMASGTVLQFHSYEHTGVVACRPRVPVTKDAGRPVTLAVKTDRGKPQRVSMPVPEAIGFLSAHPDATVVRADSHRLAKAVAGETGEQQKCQDNITAEQAFNPGNGSAFYFTVPTEADERGEGEQRDPGSRRSLRRTLAVASLQVGTSPKAFFSLPVVLHRPFPEGSVVKGVSAKREKVGKGYRWMLLVTVDYPAPAPTHGTGIAALDPGWAVGTLPEADGRLRVGGLTDEAGGFKPLELDSRFMGQMAQVEKLQSIIDTDTNAVIPLVKAWLEAHKEESILHTHLQNAALAHGNAKRTSHNDNAPRHLDRAVLEIRGGAALDDPLLRMTLEGWYKGYWHKAEWRDNLRDQNNARKLHTYREWAAEATRRYHTLVIDDADLRNSAEEPDAEKDKTQPAGGQRQSAAPSVLISAFVNAFGSAGGEVFYVQAITTRTCSKCRHVNPKQGASANREFRCDACGYTDDRERNSGLNLIRLHQEGRSSLRRLSTKVRKPSVVFGSQEACVKLEEAVDISALEPVPF